MKQKLKLNTLKRVKDESVRKQLSKQFPPDWDMEHIFEKSYQNYLKQSKTQEIPHFISVKRNQYMKALVTVACVALTFGTFGMTLFLQRSAPELPNTSQHETMESTSFPSIAEIPETMPIQTDIAVISTNPVNSETNFSVLDEPEEMTVPIIPETTDPIEPISTTAPPETDFITMELDTIPPTEQPSQSLPEPSEPLETISPISEPTSPQAPSESPAIAPVETVPETIPPIETVPVTEYQDPTEPEPYDPSIQDTTEPSVNWVKPTETQPQEPSNEPPPADEPTPTEYVGLIVTTESDGKRTIGYSWGDNLSQQELQEIRYEELKKFENLECTFSNDSYTFEMGSIYNFTLTDKQTGEVIIISHAPYWDTYNTIIAEDVRIELLSINGKNAYVVALPESTNEEGVTDGLCTLIWDTRKSVGMLHGLQSDLQTLIRIAEAFQVNSINQEVDQ